MPILPKKTDTAVPTTPGGTGAKDPTQNVIDSLNAAVQRLDDLSAQQNSSVKELFDEKIRGVREVMALRAEHQRDLMLAESRRIDAIRIVDVNAGTISNERAATQAQTLQTQVAQSAETLRALVATTATSVAAQLVQTINPIIERIATLERAQYEFKGSSSVADPQISAAIARMDKTLEALTTISTGRTAVKENSTSTVLIGAAIFGIFFGLIGAIGAVYAIIHHS